MSKATPLTQCSFRYSEPWLRTPKATNVTQYSLGGRDETLLVVNMHMVNFALGVRYIYFWNLADSETSIRNHNMFWAHILLGPLGVPDGDNVRIQNGGFLGTETQRQQRDAVANETILDGSDGSAERTVHHVVVANQVLGATLDGFTITGGHAEASDGPR